MLLSKEDWVEIAGECDNGHDAVAAIQKLKPDLVFLDVQMPGSTGFDVIDERRGGPHAGGRLRDGLRSLCAARV